MRSSNRASRILRIFILNNLELVTVNLVLLLEYLTFLYLQVMDNVKSDLARSSTLPTSFYLNEEIWEATKEKVFARTWQYVGDEKDLFNVGINLSLIHI